MVFSVYATKSFSDKADTQYAPTNVYEPVLRCSQHSVNILLLCGTELCVSCCADAPAAFPLLLAYSTNSMHNNHDVPVQRVACCNSSHMLMLQVLSDPLLRLLSFLRQSLRSIMIQTFSGTLLGKA